MSNQNYRKEIIDEIFEYVRENEQIVFLIGDMGFGVIDKLEKECQGRIYNCGMMEQGMVGVAAGMALTGLTPVVYCIVNFLAFRAIEQIRNDVVLQDLNVKFIATGANDYFKFLGDSHCCGQDDKKIMELIGMPVFDPYENENGNFSSMVNEWITSKQAGYIRV